MQIIRIAWFKDLWGSGKRFEAIKLLLRSIPNLTFPGGANEMDLRFQKYGFWDFTGPMASVTWWREVCHFIGGIILTLTLAGTFKVISIGVSELTPKLRALQIGEASFLATFAVSNLFCYLEFLRENEGKARDLKNVVDWLAWTLGSAAVTLIIMATLGPSHLL